MAEIIWIFLAIALALLIGAVWFIEWYGDSSEGDYMTATSTAPDTVAEFLSGPQVRRHILGDSVLFSDLYEAYTRYCDAIGEYKSSRKRFSQRLAEMGLRVTRTFDGRRIFTVGLIDEHATDPGESEPYRLTTGWHDPPHTTTIADDEQHG